MTTTRTVHFTARNGKVTSDSDTDRRQAQAYVNRNNAAAARRGDDSKPYAVLSFKIPALPDLTQTTPKSRPYRLFTVDHVPFDHFSEDNRPRTVVINGWGKSTSSLCRFMSSPEVVATDDGLVTLNVYASDRSGPVWVPIKHPLDGTKWATSRDADRAAYDAGVIAFMVYEDERAKYGL